MAKKIKISIVVANFNKEITNRLLACALKTLKQNADIAITNVLRVPGCFELPFGAKLAASTNDAPDAIVCLGALLKGKTDQNIYIAQACSLGLIQLQFMTGVPVSFGIIIANTYQQALARTKSPLDRGREAALAAIAMARLKKGLGV